MITTITGKILDVDSQAYEMEQQGKKIKGISNKIILKEPNGTIRKIGVKQEDIRTFEDLIGSEQSIECDVFLPLNTKVNFKVHDEELN